MPYQLPTDPSIVSNDPLGILDIEDPLQAQVLSTLLETAITRLGSGDTPAIIVPALIEDIAYTVHGNGTLDTETLRRFLSQCESSAAQDAVVNLLHAAQRLSESFPTHRLQTLNNENNICTLIGAQVDTLLSHQFFGTLYRPKGTDWGLPDFTSWYAAEQAHTLAVDGYLATIVDHFAQGGYPEAKEFSFCLQTADGMPDPSQCGNIPDVHLAIVSEESEPSHMPDTVFALVAVHSQPGPGATGTQEERLQSASPALSMSALVTPLIPDDAAIVTSAFPVHAAWKGHNRTARLDRLFPAKARPERNYILADALQIDEMEEEQDGLKDLTSGRAEREVKKLYAGFSGAVKMHRITGNSHAEPCVIETGAWGCGAFSGNILVKTVCMMIAAGLTGVELHYSLLEQREHDVREVQALFEGRRTTAALWQVLNNSRTLPDILSSLKIRL